MTIIKWEKSSGMSEYYSANGHGVYIQLNELSRKYEIYKEDKDEHNDIFISDAYSLSLAKCIAEGYLTSEDRSVDL